MYLIFFAYKSLSNDEILEEILLEKMTLFFIEETSLKLCKFISHVVKSI